MSALDAVLASALIAFSALWALGAPLARNSMRWALLCSIALSALQLAWEGFYWQFIPGYLLLALVAFPPKRSGEKRGRVPGLRWLCAGTLILALAVAWLLVPVPRLSKPPGRNSLGTAVFRWVDTKRPEEATVDLDDRRNVIVQAWYPAKPGSRGASSAYIDGLGRLPAYVSILPRFVLSRYDRVQTHAITDAPASADRIKWPVVVFSPGYGASRSFYTSVVTGLASEGYAVFAVDHPYEAAVAELADGRIVTTVENLAHNGDRIAYMSQHLDLRANDVRFVLDQLQRAGVLAPAFAARLDLDHIGVIGHSFGGATAAVAMHRDSRIKAAANIDGTLYGSIADQTLTRPFLLLQSDPAETHHSERYLSGNAQLLGKLEASGYRYEVRGANHYSFTDVPLFFSAPGRFVLARLMGGPRDVAETHQATVAILAAFLRQPLYDEPASVETVVQRYQNITGGPAQPSANQTNAH